MKRFTPYFISALFLCLAVFSVLYAAKENERIINNRLQRAYSSGWVDGCNYQIKNPDATYEQAVAQHTADSVKFVNFLKEQP